MTTTSGARTAFDTAALLAALTARKDADNISWRELARRAGMPGSYGIAAKLRRGGQPTAGVLVLLLRYLGQSDLTPYTVTDDRGPARYQPSRFQGPARYQPSRFQGPERCDWTPLPGEPTVGQARICAVCSVVCHWYVDDTGQTRRWRHSDQAASYAHGAHHPAFAGEVQR